MRPTHENRLTKCTSTVRPKVESCKTVQPSRPAETIPSSHQRPGNYRSRHHEQWQGQRYEEDLGWDTEIDEYSSDELYQQNDKEKQNSHSRYGQAHDQQTNRRRGDQQVSQVPRRWNSAECSEHRQYKISQKRGRAQVNADNQMQNHVIQKFHHGQGG